MRPVTQTWRLHLSLAIGLSICLLGFVVELRRGLDGHLPAWVYVLEWPLFAILGTAIWWRLWHDEDPLQEPATQPPQGDDPGLDAWREYVARLESGEASDPGS